MMYVVYVHENMRYTLIIKSTVITKGRFFFKFQCIEKYKITQLLSAMNDIRQIHVHTEH